MDKKRCKYDVADAGGWRFHQCMNKAVTAAGYCRVHDPDEKTKRAKKRGPTQLEREWDQAKKRRERQAAIEERLSDSTELLKLLLEGSPRLSASLRSVAERQIEKNKEALK